MFNKDLDSYSFPVKYRPQTFDDFVGNTSAVNNLKDMLNRDKGVPHAFLFTGPSGCGKTTLALLIKETLKCNDHDFIFMDNATTRDIATIRKVLGETIYKPMGGPVKFYLFDECHKLLNDSQNALLRKLEHPEPHCYFSLCTTNPEKLIDTIRNRCVEIKVKSLPSYLVVKRLKEVLEKEDISNFPVFLLKEISKVCAGSLRASLKLLDQVIDIESDKEALKVIQQTVVSEHTLKEICQLLLERSSQKWAQMSKLMKALGDDDQETMRIGILNWLTKVLLNTPNGDDRLAEMISIFNEKTYDTGKRGGIVYQLYLACKL